MGYVLFNSKYRVTQNYGVNESYYKQFGLNGHEGIDLVPTDSDWTVKAIDKGVVVRDEDNAKSGAYGMYVTIWHPHLKKATQYCHLRKNFVNIRQEVSKDQPIGEMGDTGNTKGAHLHFNLFETDENGYRLNSSNGFLGGLNPLVFIQEMERMPDEKNVTIAVSEFERINSNSNKYEEFRLNGYETVHAVKEKIDKMNEELIILRGTVDNLNKIIKDKSVEPDKLRDELKGVYAQVEALKAEIKTLQNEKEILEGSLVGYGDLVERNEVLQTQYGELKIENDQLQKEVEGFKSQSVTTLLKAVIEKLLKE